MYIYICIYNVRLNVIINILKHKNDFIIWVFIYMCMCIHIRLSQHDRGNWSIVMPGYKDIYIYLSMTEHEEVSP